MTMTDARLISLSGDAVAIVSLCDFDRVSAYRWKATEVKRGYVYAYRYDADAHRNVHMHRDICDAPRDMVVDHINGNTLDNRRENLRVVTTAQNLQNITREPRGRTGYRNIYPHKSGFIVRAFRNGRRIYAGWHPTLKDAIAARDAIPEIVDPLGDRARIAAMQEVA